MRARMRRSCGRTRGGRDPLNSFCGPLPLLHLAGEQQRSSKSQAAWGVLQKLQWHPEEGGSLREDEYAWHSLQIPHRSRSLHSSFMPILGTPPLLNSTVPPKGGAKQIPSEEEVAEHSHVMFAVVPVSHKTFNNEAFITERQKCSNNLNCVNLEFMQNSRKLFILGILTPRS